MGVLLVNLLRILFSWLDRLVIVVMNALYSLLVKIASLNIVSASVIKGFGNRIGLLLGIFMLFSLAVYFLNYLVSPDKFADKGKGGAKLVTNIIISLILLATFNWIFATAYKVQYKILEKQILPQLIFGVSGKGVAGDEISYYVFSGLVSVNPTVDPGGECKNVYLSVNSDDCYKLLTQYLGSDVDKYKNAIDNKDASGLLDIDNISATTLKNNDYVFDYQFVFSTVIGVIIVIILFNFCLDVGKRSVKLYFLQIIAPLPIIANMIPGKGEETFKKWYKTCFTTYLDLFIRLIALFFATYMITIVYDSITDVWSSHPFLGIFIILGALIFAQELPKLIQDITGLKLDGQFSLNPLRKFQNNPLIGYGAAGLAGAAAFGTNMIAHKGNILGRLGSGIAGGFSATGRGIVGAARGQRFGEVFNGAYSGSNTARNNRVTRRRLDISSGDLFINNMQRRMGIDTESDIQDQRIKLYDDVTSSSEAAVSVSEAELDKNAHNIDITRFGGLLGTYSGPAINTLAELREAMSDVSRDSTERAALNAEYNRLRGDIAEEIRTEVGSGSIANDIRFQYTDASGNTKSIFEMSNPAMATIKGHMNNIQDIVDRHQDDPIFKGQTVDGKTIKSIGKDTKSASATIRNNGEYRRAHQIQEQARRENRH